MSSRATSREPHRVRDLIIDIAVVLVLGAHLAAFVAIRSAQAQYDDEAEDIAAWAQSQGVSRVSWPRDLRSAVPTLVRAGVTPVLYDDAQLNAQQMVVGETPIVVTRNTSDALDDLTTDELAAGPLDAALIDLAAAALVPLEAGQSIEIDYSRPLVYAPIHDSLVLVVGEPLQIPLTLTRGDYQLTTEALDPELGLDLTLSVAADGGQPLTQTFLLGQVVWEPQVFRFGVFPEDPTPFMVQMAVSFVDGADATADSAAVLHGWSLVRTG